MAPRAGLGVTDPVRREELGVAALNPLRAADELVTVPRRSDHVVVG